jgi:hypothetical protein
MPMPAGFRAGHKVPARHSHLVVVDGRVFKLQGYENGYFVGG